MPTESSRDAVIVATARSPIGRAHKGSLRDVRPDDLAATIVRAALDKVPQLDPAEIDDLYLGCGLPGGEQGFNMARVVATLMGLDGLPGATLTRYCASSLQTTRMAMHAIRAGEGDVFVSAGVEMVSRYARGNSDGLPPEAQALVGGGWENPASRRHGSGRRSAPRAARRSGRTRESPANCPTSTWPWDRPPRTWPRCTT